METQRVCERASASLAEENETHVIFAIDRKTQAIRVVGDEASVDYFTRQDKNLLAQVKAALTNVQRQQIQGFQGQGKLRSNTRLHLFAEPGSKEWKGVEKIRTQCSQLLSLGGFGHKEKTLFGSGDPPVGWPYPYMWSNFTGPSRASLIMNTQIIQGIDLLHFSQLYNLQATRNQKILFQGLMDGKDFLDEHEHEEVAQADQVARLHQLLIKFVKSCYNMDFVNKPGIFICYIAFFTES